MQKKLLILSLVFSLSGLAVLDAASRHLVAIKTKLTITGRGRNLNGATIMIDDGKITDVGPKIKIPWNAEVIDATEKTVMPGFVLAHTSRGLERANESMPDVPYLSTFDAIDPFESIFRSSLRNGVTSMLILPGNNTRFGGTGTVVKPTGKTVDEMLIMKDIGLKISLSPAGRQGRMGHMQRLRKYFTDSKKSLAEWEKKKKAKDGKKSFSGELDPGLKVMQKLFTKKLRAFVYCPSASDVIRAIELIREYKFGAVLVLGKSAWKAAPFIAKAHLPVVLPADIVFYEKDPDTDELKLRNLPKMFQKLRIPFAFQTNPSSYDSRFLWQIAAEAVKHGLSRGSAISAATSTPANMIGLGSKTGQIKQGMQADLLFLTGDPLDPKTWIDKVMIGGKVVYDRSKDKYLKELLKGNKK